MTFKYDVCVYMRVHMLGTEGESEITSDRSSLVLKHVGILRGTPTLLKVKDI